MSGLELALPAMVTKPVTGWVLMILDSLRNNEK